MASRRLRLSHCSTAQVKALGDLPINSLVRDDLTGDLYAATDFGVLRRDAQTGHWHTAAKGLPMVEVSSLAIDSSKRVMYAATHGRSAWRVVLATPKGEQSTR